MLLFSSFDICYCMHRFDPIPLGYRVNHISNNKHRSYTSTMHTRRCKHTPPPYPAEAVSLVSLSIRFTSSVNLDSKGRQPIVPSIHRFGCHRESMAFLSICPSRFFSGASSACQATRTF